MEPEVRGVKIECAHLCAIGKTVNLPTRDEMLIPAHRRRVGLPRSFQME